MGGYKNPILVKKWNHTPVKCKCGMTILRGDYQHRKYCSYKDYLPPVTFNIEKKKVKIDFT